MRILPESSLAEGSQEEECSILIEVRLECKLIRRLSDDILHLVFVRLLRWIDA